MGEENRRKIVANKLQEDGGIRYIWIETPKNFDKVYVLPMADCHMGARQFDEKKFRGYCKWIADTPEAYCFWNGDLCNCGLPDTVDSDWWEQSPLTPQDQVQRIVEIVKDYDLDEKTLCVIGGSNHPARARKRTGHDYDKEFAEKLGIPDLYSRDGVVMLLKVGHWQRIPVGKTRAQKPPSTQQIPYTIFATHGWAGGRLIGSSMNATRELGGVWLCDIYVTSHRHVDTVTPDLFFVPNMAHPTIEARKRMFVGSGSFLKYGGYSLAKGYRANVSNTPRIRLDGKRKDVHVSI